MLYPMCGIWTDAKYTEVHETHDILTQMCIGYTMKIYNEWDVLNIH